MKRKVPQEKKQEECVVLQSGISVSALHVCICEMEHFKTPAGCFSDQINLTNTMEGPLSSIKQYRKDNWKKTTSLACLSVKARWLRCILFIFPTALIIVCLVLPTLHYECWFLYFWIILSAQLSSINCVHDWMVWVKIGSIRTEGQLNKKKG